MRILAVLLFLIPLGAARGAAGVPGQRTLAQYASLYISTDQRNVSPDELMGFVEKLEARRDAFKHEKAFVNHVFAKTHQRFLKNYSEYASFSSVLDKGTYNCLTATALYALLLDHLRIPYRIVETNYHIFLMVETIEGRVLLETTDPANGFVQNEKEIEKRIATYRENNVQEGKGKNYYQFNFDVYHEVSLDQMLGLLYYNQAVNAYNHRQLAYTITLLDKAFALYPSPRMEEFSRIVLLSVIESPMEQPEKERCVKQMQTIRKRRTEVVASAVMN